MGETGKSHAMNKTYTGKIVFRVQFAQFSTFFPETFL
jgi:hypothetical protein